MELRLPAAQGGILLILSLAVHPRSRRAFFNPLNIGSSASAPPPPPTTSVFIAAGSDAIAGDGCGKEGGERGFTVLSEDGGDDGWLVITKMPFSLVRVTTLLCWELTLFGFHNPNTTKTTK